MNEVWKCPNRSSTEFEREILNWVEGDYCQYDDPFNIRDQVPNQWASYDQRIYWPLLHLVMSFEPTTTPELAEQSLIEVNVKTKKGFTGKRGTVKISRFLRTNFDKLPDHRIEKYSSQFHDKYKPFYGEFHIAKDGFEKIVTMICAKEIFFNTDCYNKSLFHSCMRHEARDFGLSNHPYTAYESGDFELAYMTQGNKLAARTIIHTKSGTHSAIYANSKGAIAALDAELKKLGYSRVSEEGAEWEGARLLKIRDTFDRGEDEYEEYRYIDVTLAPYVDFWEDGIAWSKVGEGYMYLFTERPGANWYPISLGSPDGFDEDD